LIRWGTYPRWLFLGQQQEVRLRIQRLRCKVCGRTHSLLPDFVQAYRRYPIELIQEAIVGYVIAGQGWRRLLEALSETVPGSTVREWIAAWAYGAGELLLDRLTRSLLQLNPLAALPDAPPPPHLDRVPDADKHRRLGRAHRFFLLAEQLYAQIKTRLVRLHFAGPQLFRFLLHWLQQEALPPRLLWSPRLATTPRCPF
jgi:hypothetical protein